MAAELSQVVAEANLARDLEERIKRACVEDLINHGLPVAISLSRSYSVGVVADAVARFRGRNVSQGVKVRIENCVVAQTLVIHLTW